MPKLALILDYIYTGIVSILGSGNMIYAIATFKKVSLGQVLEFAEHLLITSYDEVVCFVVIDHRCFSVMLQLTAQLLIECACGVSLAKKKSKHFNFTPL